MIRSISSGNDLAPNRCQAITWSNAENLLWRQSRHMVSQAHTESMNKIWFFSQNTSAGATNRRPSCLVRRSWIIYQTRWMWRTSPCGDPPVTRPYGRHSPPPVPDARENIRNILLSLTNMKNIEKLIMISTPHISGFRQDDGNSSASTMK